MMNDEKTHQDVKSRLFLTSEQLGFEAPTKRQKREGLAKTLETAFQNLFFTFDGDFDAWACHLQALPPTHYTEGLEVLVAGLRDVFQRNPGLAEKVRQWIECVPIKDRKLILL